MRTFYEEWQMLYVNSAVETAEIQMECDNDCKSSSIFKAITLSLNHYQNSVFPSLLAVFNQRSFKITIHPY